MVKFRLVFTLYFSVGVVPNFTLGFIPSSHILPPSLSSSSSYTQYHSQIPIPSFLNLSSTDQQHDDNANNDNNPPPTTTKLNFHHQSNKIPLHDSFYTPILSTLDLQPLAIQLRQTYDSLFDDPRQPNVQRFIWDPWFVLYKDGKYGNNNNNNKTASQERKKMDGEEEATGKQIQYSLKRIQASTLFSLSSLTSDSDDDDDKPNEQEDTTTATNISNLYTNLIVDLTTLGRSIGLKSITPPWISLYTHGDLQNFHTDAPQGPMAFVFSLSREGDFQGGETMMLQSTILEYWRGKTLDLTKGLECGDIVRYIPPTPLGRCIAFDPRVPHGVTPVIGSNDPRRGRIVIHGWFNDPEVCWFGPWPVDDEDDSDNAVKEDEYDDVVPSVKTTEYLDDALGPLLELLGNGDIGRVMGYLAVRLDVDSDGSVMDVIAVCDTLQADWDDFRGIIGYDEGNRPVMEDSVSDIRLTIFEACKDFQFDEITDGGVRSLIIPFVFE